MPMPDENKKKMVNNFEKIQYNHSNRNCCDDQNTIPIKSYCSFHHSPVTLNVCKDHQLRDTSFTQSTEALLAYYSIPPQLPFTRNNSNSIVIQTKYQHGKTDGKTTVLIILFLLLLFQLLGIYLSNNSFELNQNR